MKIDIQNRTVRISLANGGQIIISNNEAETCFRYSYQITNLIRSWDVEYRHGSPKISKSNEGDLICLNNDTFRYKVACKDNNDNILLVPFSYEAYVRKCGDEIVQIDTLGRLIGVKGSDDEIFIDHTAHPPTFTSNEHFIKGTHLPLKETVKRLINFNENDDGNNLRTFGYFCDDILIYVNRNDIKTPIWSYENANNIVTYYVESFDGTMQKVSYTLIEPETVAAAPEVPVSSTVNIVNIPEIYIKETELNNDTTIKEGKQEETAAQKLAREEQETVVEKVVKETAADRVRKRREQQRMKDGPVKTNLPNLPSKEKEFGYTPPKPPVRFSESKSSESKSSESKSTDSQNFRNIKIPSMFKEEIMKTFSLTSNDVVGIFICIGVIGVSLFFSGFINLKLILLCIPVCIGALYYVFPEIFNFIRK